MDLVSLIVGVADIFTGLLILAISMPLARRKVKMNKWYGVRFRQSFESEANWYAINEYGGKRLVFWSLMLIAAGVLVLFIPLRDNFSWIIPSLLPALFISIPAIQSYFYAQRL